MSIRFAVSCFALLGLLGGPADPGRAEAPAADEKPKLHDFMGLNGHTVQFRPKLYRPVASLVRDYHNFDWDVGDASSTPTRFPMSQNQVDWDALYGSWTQAGFRINVAVQFGGFGEDRWHDVPADATRYGREFARHFGPTLGNGLVDSLQIGNEPGFYSDDLFREIFRHMAEGAREADPALTIVTCNTVAGESHDYAKSLDAVFGGLPDLYEVIATHSYPMAEQWPTWRRSFPEDPRIDYLTKIQDVIDWRDRHAPSKPIWLTEFGYDASTQQPDRDGPNPQWVGVTDTEQARYLIRSFLAFTAMDLDRAYVYWFNDQDQPSLHASSGLTRNYEPKPSYYAMRHLHQELGPYRLNRVVERREGDRSIFEYQHGDDPSRLAWVVWSPTGEDRSAQITLENMPGLPDRAEGMPLADGDPPSVPFDEAGPNAIQLEITESPTYLWFRVEP